VLWTSTSDAASYASPVAATIGGQRRLFVITRDALVAADPTDGHVLFRHPWRPASDASVSAASPLVFGDLIFLSASYGTGASLLRFHPDKPQTIWALDDVLSNHYATSVHHDELLFGFDGRQEQGCELRCVDLKTGHIRWSERGMKAGTVLISNGQLLVLTESGELLIAPAISASFRPSSRAQILPFGARAHPALSGGFLYARSKDKLICVDLRASK
jgi:outer membrane protein assembly factor BamB